MVPARFQLGGPITFSGGGLSITSRNGLPTDIFVAGGSSSGISGGTIRILNTSVLPTTSRLGVSNGLFDFGANNITIAALNFVNQSDGLTLWNPATGVAGAGVFGTGTLRVTGEIHTIGVFGDNFGSNTVANNLDLGGGTQIVRTASNGSFIDFRALQFSGVLSNGSLLKTFGFTENGILGQPDGIALYGNNTYTGSTTFNGGRSIITGTNATTSFQVVGDRGPFAPSGSTVTLQGANGSLLSATTIQAFAGGQFIIDNTVSLPAGGDTPTIPAAQNNNRIGDDAEIQLREGVVHLSRPDRNRSERDLRQPERHRRPQHRHPLHQWRGRDCDIDRERQPHARAAGHAPDQLDHARRRDQVLCQRHPAGGRRDRHPAAHDRHRLTS